MNAKQLQHFTTMLAVTLCICLQSCSKEQERPKVTISVAHQSLERVIKEIRKQTKYDYITTQKSLDKVRNVNLQVVDADVNQTLDLMFKDSPLTYEIVNKTIVITERTEK